MSPDLRRRPDQSLCPKQCAARSDVLPSSKHEMRAAYRTAAGTVRHRANDDELITLRPKRRNCFAFIRRDAASRGAQPRYRARTLLRMNASCTAWSGASSVSGASVSNHAPFFNERLKSARPVKPARLPPRAGIPGMRPKRPAHPPSPHATLCFRRTRS